MQAGGVRAKGPPFCPSWRATVIPPQAEGLNQMEFWKFLFGEPCTLYRQVKLGNSCSIFFLLCFSQWEDYLFNFLWYEMSLTVSVPCLSVSSFHGCRRELLRGALCLAPVGHTYSPRAPSYQEPLQITVHHPSCRSSPPQPMWPGGIFKLAVVSI